MNRLLDPCGLVHCTKNHSLKRCCSMSMTIHHGTAQHCACKGCSRSPVKSVGRRNGSPLRNPYAYSRVVLPALGAASTILFHTIPGFWLVSLQLPSTARRRVRELVKLRILHTDFRSPALGRLTAQHFSMRVIEFLGLMRQLDQSKQTLLTPKSMTSSGLGSNYIQSR